MLKKVYVDNVGEITLRKIRNAKRIALKVKQTGEVLVTMPLSVTYSEALDFAHQQKAWIQSVHEKVKINQQQSVITSKQNNVFSFFNVHFKVWNEPRLKVQFIPPALTLFCPSSIDEKDTEVQNLLKDAIGNILRLEAKKRLPEMIERLAKENGFVYNKLSIRKSATRWGSCSTQKNINLSVYLMLLPDELIEYVILHELCHTLEMNHGEGFYQHMDRVTHGQTMALKTQLKMEGAKWNFLKQKTEL